jgi:hypothetical protein
MERFDYIQDLLYELYEVDNESDIQSVFSEELEELSDIESVYTNEVSEDEDIEETIEEEETNTNYFEFYFNKYKEKLGNKLNENKIELEFKYKLIKDIDNDLKEPICHKKLKPNYNGKSKYH